MAPADDRRRWHIDKTVPLAALLAAAIQFVALVWWGAMMTARVEQLERQQTAAAPQAERLIRVEEKLGAVQAALVEIKAALTAAAAAPQRR